MTGSQPWTPDRVRRVAASWVWVPPEARELRTDDYHLVAYPETFQVPTTAWRVRGERDAAALVEEIRAHVAAWERSDVSFWVADESVQAGLEQHLRALGAEHVESVDVLGWDLTGPLPTTPAFPGVVRVVDDEESLRSAYDVEAEVWGQAPPTAETLARTLAELTGADPVELRTLALLDRTAVSVGGATFCEGGEVVRLWGAGTRPAYRGRGAYQAVLAERLRLAQERGARVVVVKAVTTTSSPILRHLGFQVYGREHRLRLPVPTRP